ncbi:hypothetical protein MR810_05645, partial [bacterium]|nr:hypothetical protein [bacterium]
FGSVDSKTRSVLGWRWVEADAKQKTLRWSVFRPTRADACRPPRVVMQHANRCTQSGVVKPKKAESNERRQWRMQRGGSPVSKGALGSRSAATLRDLAALCGKIGSCRIPQKR